MTLDKPFYLIIIFIFCSVLSTKSQVTLTPHKLYPVIPLPKISAKEILWERRLWREIDVREKMNHHLYFYNKNPLPNASLFDILWYAVQKGKLTAYTAINDNFEDTLSINQIKKLLIDSVFDSITHQKIAKSFNSRDVIKYWLIEDWIYDNKYATIKVRIKGICPVRIKYDEKGNILGYQQLFWLYFPSVRNVLVNYDAFKNIENQPRISFDDVFIKRMFSSFIIIRKDNRDLHVNKNKTELDKKLEIERTIFYSYNTQTGLWGN